MTEKNPQPTALRRSEAAKGEQVAREASEDCMRIWKRQSESGVSRASQTEVSDAARKKKGNIGKEA
jgi:hypothetical protein